VADHDLGLNDWDPIRAYVHGILCQNHDDWHYARISYYVRQPRTLLGQYAVQVLGEIGDARGWPPIAETLPSLDAGILTHGCEAMEKGRPVEEVYLRAISRIDAAAAAPILKSYLANESKVYLHPVVSELLVGMGG